jgi:hypothetical protein
MKQWWLVSIAIVTIVLLFSSCVQPLTPSKVNMPSTGEEGNWVLAPDMMAVMTPVFSSDGKTIYGLIDAEEKAFLVKSDDGGYTWTRLPGLDGLGLFEAFRIVALEDDLFVNSFRAGTYRSTNSGKTFQEMPSVPGVDEGKVMVWCFDAALDTSGKPVLMAGTFSPFPSFFGGLWILGYPYETWVDMRIGNADSGTKYNVCQVAFSPNYAGDKQIIAVVSDGQHLRVTMKYGDEGWGEDISNAQIPDGQTDYDAFFVSNISFPDDYDSQKPAIFLGTGIVTELIPSTLQYTDAYRIDGMPAGSGLSTVTDLDVGGKGTDTQICSIAVKGPANSATILAGGVGNIYRSTDGGKNWQGAAKPPTGGSVWSVAFALRGDSVAYCFSQPATNVLVPRGAEVPVGESAFCRSVDGGITWNELSIISTTIDETISHVASPDYAEDKTMFMLTRSRCSTTVSFNEDEMVVITRDPNKSGTKAEVMVVNHGGNPPNNDIVVRGNRFPVGVGINFAVDDDCPSITVRSVPWLIQSEVTKWIKENVSPQFQEQYLTLYQQPMKTVICIVDGSVTVTKAKGTILVDGEANDWQDIEPLLTDPQGDAPSENGDLEAFYVTNDREYLYFMVECCGQEPRLHGDILIDMDFDGKEDYIILIKPPQEPHGPAIHLFTPESLQTRTAIAEDTAGFGTVMEGRIPLVEIGSPSEFWIHRVHLMNVVDESMSRADEWDGPLQVNIKEFAAPTSTPIPFPSTESLWKTTDGGKTWERILTSNLKLLVDGNEIQVGTLESVTLSDNFAQDNTLFVLEGGDNPRTWVSTDDGATFALKK